MSGYICPQCQSVYVSALAASCCDESAWGEDD